MLRGAVGATLVALIASLVPKVCFASSSARSILPFCSPLVNDRDGVLICYLRRRRVYSYAAQLPTRGAP